MSERRTYDPAKLKRRRKEAGFTQEGLAFKAHITSTHISRLERGKGTNISALYLEALAKALKCRPVDLQPDEPREADVPREAAA